MPDNLKNDINLLKRKFGLLVKELEKSPAISKPLQKSFVEVFNAVIISLNSMEATKVSKEK